MSTFGSPLIARMSDAEERREIGPEHIRSAGVDLAEQLRLVTCPVKANLDAADTGKQAGDGQPACFRRRVPLFIGFEIVAR